MARLAILGLVLFAGTCFADSSRIVGGNPAPIQSYPSVVQIEFRGVVSGTWSQSCAGSIVTNTYIISGARCFSGPLYDSSLRRVRAGTATRSAGGNIVGVYSALNHPAYGVAAPFDADISLVRLNGFLSFTPNIQQGPILSPGSTVPDNLPVTVAGWGNTQDGGQPSPVLQDTLLFTVNHDVCRQNYAGLPIPGVVTDNMICAGVLGAGGRDACQGDAGAPVFVSNVVIGIVSWGHGCGLGDFPGVSTFIAPFTNWIIANAV